MRVPSPTYALTRPTAEELLAQDIRRWTESAHAWLHAATVGIWREWQHYDCRYAPLPRGVPR